MSPFAFGFSETGQWICKKIVHGLIPKYIQPRSWPASINISISGKFFEAWAYFECADLRSQEKICQQKGRKSGLKQSCELWHLGAHNKSVQVVGV